MRETLDFAGFFFLGLVGGFGHCVGMCAPFVLFVSRRFVPLDAGRPTLIWQQSLYGFGRLTTYAALGAIAGALGAILDLAASLAGVQRVAGIFAGAVLVLWALVSLANLLPSLATQGGPLFGRVAKMIRKRAPGNAFVTGLALGFLPCGLVYSALIAATGRGSAAQGAVGLVLFGLGTIPGMLGLSLADELFARRRAFINRLSMIFVLVMGLYFVWQGVVAR